MAIKEVVVSQYTVCPIEFFFKLRILTFGGSGGTKAAIFLILGKFNGSD